MNHHDLSGIKLSVDTQADLERVRAHFESQFQKYNDAATVIEKIKAAVEIQKAYATAYGAIAANAEIKVVTGGEGGNILGLPMNAKTGADLGQLLEGLGLDKVQELVSKVTRGATGAAK